MLTEEDVLQRFAEKEANRKEKAEAKAQKVVKSALKVSKPVKKKTLARRSLEYNSSSSEEEDLDDVEKEMKENVVDSDDASLGDYLEDYDDMDGAGCSGTATHRCEPAAQEVDVEASEEKTQEVEQEEVEDEVVEQPEEEDDDVLRDLVENSSHVIVEYEGSHFPGIVKLVKKSSVVVACMQAAGIGFWKWPDREDVTTYQPSQLVKKIQPPSLSNSRNQYVVPEINKYW